MTKLLTQAFEKASELPEDLQDQLAQELFGRNRMGGSLGLVHSKAHKTNWSGWRTKLCGNNSRARPRELDSTISYTTRQDTLR